MTFLRNTWYVAAWSHEIGDGLFHRKILDEQVLLFRNGQRNVGAIADVCPHRFAPLHMGKKIGGNVECGYHGLQFDVTGACVRNPHGDGRLPSCRVKSYPVAERHGAVWIWPGLAERATPETIPDFSHLDAPTNKTIFGGKTVQANYELLNDNLMDGSHTQYVHSDLLGQDSFRRSKHEIVREANTISSNYDLPAGEIPAAYRMYFDDPDQQINYSSHFRWYPASLVRNTVSLVPVDRSKAGIQRIGTHCMTPETAISTHYFFAHTRGFRLDDESIDDQIRRWQETGLVEQDGAMLEAVQKSMGTTDLNSLRPALFAIDPAAVRVRQALKQLRKQDALVGSVAPMASVPDDTKSGHYDFIIVGAGSAGCVLANRLTADTGARVLLLEAGGRDLNPLIHVPLGLGKLHEYNMHDWGYAAEAEQAVDGRRLEARRGKVLGGSSSVNVMAYTRGDPGDYDRWARNGASGWSYAEVLPYFKRCETWVGGENDFRGGSGPLGVEWGRTTDPVFDAWRAAAQALGYPATDDFNGASGEGFGRAQYTIRNGRRASAASAFLKPALRRPNLVLKTNAYGLRVILKGTRAIGIEYDQHGRRRQAYAEREVILSGGTFNTPQLLMLSGIGPADHLREIGIPTVADLPVGHNLQDHLAVLIMLTRPMPGSFHSLMRMDRMALAMARAYLFGTGQGTVIPSGLYGFIKTRPDLDVPDLEFMFRGVPMNLNLWFPGIVAPYQDGFGIRPCLLHPESRGRVLLRSTDPYASVRIRYNFFSEPYDLQKLREGFKIGREISRRPEIAPFCGMEKTPGEAVKTDAEIDAYIRRSVTTVHHPAGTCPMGDRDAVLDPHLRVLGIDGLRVVDASAMPDLISAHINACVLMMAEKAADMILGNAISDGRRRSPP